MKKFLKKFFIIVVVLGIATFIWWWFFAPIDYYEYEAESPGQCLDGEEYDAEFQVCYFDFTCETESECAEVDTRYEQVLASLEAEYLLSDHDHATYGIEQELEPIAEFEITDGELQEISTSENPVEAAIESTPTGNAWNIVQTIVPSSHLGKIVSYQEETDGRDGVLAFVEPADERGSQWVFGVDPKDAYTRKGGYRNLDDLLITLVHEFAHILTLDSTQVEHGQNCGLVGYETYEGCAHQDSYISLFVDQFWLDDLEQLFALENDQEDPSLYFYEQTPNNYVTEYAATNPGEDIAESFSLFIIGAGRTGNSIADQKVNFFYDFPELVAMRNFMRGRIARVKAQ